MNTGMPQQQRPDYLSPTMANILVGLIQNSRQRNQRYIAEVNARTVGLQQFATQCQQDINTLMQRGNQQGAQRLMTILRAVSQLADTTGLLKAISDQEQELDMTVQRVLMGLPPALTVPAQAQGPMPSPNAQQPMQPQGGPPVSMAQMQGPELLQAVQGAERMPLVAGGMQQQTHSLAPQAVVQIPNAAPGAAMPPPGTSVLVSQTPNPPQAAPAAAPVNGTNGAPAAAPVPAAPSGNAPAAS